MHYMKESMVCVEMQAQTSPAGVIVQHLIVATTNMPAWMVATTNVSGSMSTIYFLIF